MPLAATWLVLPLGLVAVSVEPAPGDTPPPGPPWKLSYREAARDALRAGRPVFVYFTKTY